MSNELLCQYCSEPLLEGDMVARCIIGKIQDGYDANELHVESVLWFHEGCFYSWKLEDKKEIEVMNKK